MNRKKERAAKLAAQEAAAAQGKVPVRRHVCGWSADEIRQLAPQERGTPMSPYHVGLTGPSRPWAGQRVQETDKRFVRW